MVTVEATNLVDTSRIQKWIRKYFTTVFIFMIPLILLGLFKVYPDLWLLWLLLLAFQLVIVVCLLCVDRQYMWENMSDCFYNTLLSRGSRPADTVVANGSAQSASHMLGGFCSAIRNSCSVLRWQ